MSVPQRIRVGVIRGGHTLGYDHSLESGHTILKILRTKPDAYDPVDIFVSKSGEWHRNGRTEEPHKALRHIDLAWNALAGPYGESGHVQKLLHDLHIPHVGSSHLASAMTHQKNIASALLRDQGYNVLRHETIHEDEYSREKLGHIFRNYLYPLRVRPMGAHHEHAHIVHTFKELEAAVAESLTHSRKVVIEEWVRGKDVHSGVVERLRGENLYALLPTPSLSHTTHHRAIEEAARGVHQALGLRHFSSTHFVVTPRGKIYVIDTRTVPVFHPSSHLEDSLRAVGVTPKAFVEHLIHISRPTYVI